MNGHHRLMLAEINLCKNGLVDFISRLGTFCGVHGAMCDYLPY
jgi:hypothetical protein